MNDLKNYQYLLNAILKNIRIQNVSILENNEINNSIKIYLDHKCHESSRSVYTCSELFYVTREQLKILLDLLKNRKEN